MEKRLAFGALLVLMTLVSTAGFVSATPGTTYTFTLSGAGTSYHPASPALSGTKAKGFYDTYVLTTSKTLKVTIVLEAGGVMGNTIALYSPLTTKLASAQSPDLIVKTYLLIPGTYYFYVGFTGTPNAFPASYVIFFDATCGLSTGSC